MAPVLTLESFEEALVDQNGTSDDYAAGYADGLAAGEAAARAEIGVLNDQFVQSVQDINFTFAEARGQVLASITPLIETIIAQVLPHCVQSGFAGQLAQLLIDAAHQDAARPLSLHVHPDCYDAMLSLSHILPKECSVEADSGLAPHAAWIAQSNGEMSLDMDQLLTVISERLSILTIPEERDQMHG